MDETRAKVEAALAHAIADADVEDPEELLRDALDAVMAIVATSSEKKNDTPPDIAASAALRTSLKAAADALSPFAAMARHVHSPDPYAVLAKGTSSDLVVVRCGHFRAAMKTLLDLRAALDNNAIHRS